MITGSDRHCNEESLRRRNDLSMVKMGVSRLKSGNI